MFTMKTSSVNPSSSLNPRCNIFTVMALVALKRQGKTIYVLLVPLIDSEARSNNIASFINKNRKAPYFIIYKDNHRD